MALAAEYGYPVSLDACSKALGVTEKDSAGAKLVKLFTMPNRDGSWNTPETHPMEWLDFIAYCEQDVATLMDVDARLGDWPSEFERQLYLVDQHVNDTGIKIDLDMVQTATRADQDNRLRAKGELIKLTGMENPNSGPQMHAWLATQKVKLPDLQAETIENKLKQDGLTPLVRQVLELKQILALTSTLKYPAAINSVCLDGRLRGSFMFHGAQTGRWTGRGVQPQNLPRAAFKRWDDVEEDWVHDEIAESAAILDLKMGMGGDADVLKKLVRAMFVGPYIIFDFSAIEARVLAWLAGEQWVLDAFLENKDLYVETAERMSNEKKTYVRHDGKVAVLALGFQGYTGALERMGAKGSQAELKGIANQWRNANPKIVKFWALMQQKFWTGGHVGKFVKIEVHGKDRHMVLPSGRKTIYHDVRRYADPERGGFKMSYKSPKGYRVDLYGGILTENVTQGVARDLLAGALIRLHDAGHRTVAHVHDEAVIEDEGQSLDDIHKLMCELPDWAVGLPIDAKGIRTERYRKD
jgi:DNA polymerase